MRIKKYICATILFCIVLFGMTICASAKMKENDEYQYEIIKRNGIYMHSSENVFGDIEQGIYLYRYLGNQTEVEIPEEIDGLPVIRMSCACFDENENLQKVTIPKSMVWIDGFSNCTNLVNVVMEEGLRVIGCDAFTNCTSLEKIDLPDSVDFIGGFELDCSTFSHCTSLKEIRLPKNLKRMDNYAFSGCSSLEKVDLPEKLEYISDGCFAGCSALKSVVIPNNCTYIAPRAFRNCTSLEKVTLPSALQVIDAEAFYGCSSLYKIKFPKGLKVIETDAFRNSGLKGTTIPATVTKIGKRAFAHCVSMKKVIIKGKNTTILSLAFKGINPKAVFDVPNHFIQTYQKRLTKRETGFLKNSMKII